MTLSMIIASNEILYDYAWANMVQWVNDNECIIQQARFYGGFTLIHIG